jgi:hypothetical protein
VAGNVAEPWQVASAKMLLKKKSEATDFVPAELHSLPSK